MVSLDTGIIVLQCMMQLILTHSNVLFIVFATDINPTDSLVVETAYQIIIITMGQEDSKLATGFSVFQLHIGYGYIDMLLIVSVQQLYGLKLSLIHISMISCSSAPPNSLSKLTPLPLSNTWTSNATSRPLAIKSSKCFCRSEERRVGKEC